MVIHVSGMPTGHGGVERIGDRVGLTHVAALYSHRDGIDSLNEGAEVIEEMGGSVMKIFMASDYESHHYQWNISWPDPRPGTLKQLSKTAPFDSLFKRPGILTYLIVAISFEVGTYQVEWKDGLSSAESDAVYQEIYDYVVHLRNSYPGKTFVVQNWECDNAFPVGLNAADKLRAERGMIDWLNIRDAAVAEAKADTPSSSTKVWHAIEFNWLRLSHGENMPHYTIETVIPSTSADLYSLSSWSTGKNDTNFREYDIEAYMAYVENACPDSEAFGANNVMIGEFGSAENQLKGLVVDADGSYASVDLANDEEARYVTHRQVTGRQLEQFLHWGVPYIAQWSLYDNELAVGVSHEAGTEVTVNTDVKGFHAIRPDGSKALTYNLFRAVLAEPVEEYRNVFEFENQFRISSQSELSDVTDARASGGAYLHIVSPSKWDDTIVQSYIQQPGTYQVEVGIKSSPDGGTFLLRIADYDVGTSVDTYAETEAFGSVILSDTVTFDPVGIVGPKVFGIRCLDANGASTGTNLYIDYIKLIPFVNDPNLQPNVKVNRGMSRYAEIGENSTRAVELSANDPDGSISRLRAFIDGQLVGEVTNQSNYLLENAFPGLTPGTHVFEVSATDNQGERDSLSFPFYIVPAVGELTGQRAHTFGGEHIKEYLRFVPPHYNDFPGREWPLMIWLHGRDALGTDAYGLLYEGGPPSRIGEIAQLNEFIVISPRVTTNWRENGSQAELDALVDSNVARFRVDPERLIITGQGMGGSGTYLNIKTNPNGT